MLERLRMQEVQQIVLSLPEGAIINGARYYKDEPIMIIEKPSLSNMAIRTTDTTVNDGRGFIGASTLTNRIDFVINEGSILYSVWSYLNGTHVEEELVELKGTEWLYPKNGKCSLSTDYNSEARNFIVYEQINGELIRLKPEVDFIIYRDEETQSFILELVSSDEEDVSIFITYDYKIRGQRTRINQVHNNIFCTVDIYFDAIDMITDEHHTVCFHCDKAQIFMDMIIDINSSTKASFTPIRIVSIPTPKADKPDINKDIGYFTVV